MKILRLRISVKVDLGPQVNNQMKLLAIVGVFSIALSMYNWGYYKGSQHGEAKTIAIYDKKLLAISQEYSKSVEQARSTELYWKSQADAIEKSYKKKLADNIHSNDAIINRLQHKLDEASKRLSSNSNTPSKLNDSSRGSKVSEGVGRIVKFADRCARRHDDLVIQVESLQQWINKETK